MDPFSACIAYWVLLAVSARCDGDRLCAVQPTSASEISDAVTIPRNTTTSGSYPMMCNVMVASSHRPNAPCVGDVDIRQAVSVNFQRTAGTPRARYRRNRLDRFDWESTGSHRNHFTEITLRRTRKMHEY